MVSNCACKTTYVGSPDPKGPSTHLSGTYGSGASDGSTGFGEVYLDL